MGRHFCNCAFPSCPIEIHLQFPVADPGFSPGGAPTPKIAFIFQIFAENFMKMNEFRHRGVSLVPPLDPPMVSFIICTT